LAFECAPACKKAKAKCGKGKLARCKNCTGLPENAGNAKIRAMKPTTGTLVVFAVAAFSGRMVSAQTFASAPAKPTEANEIRALAKKIDEQNAKIDALSQQILQLEREIAKMRPGVIIGEATPTPTRKTPAPATEQSKATADNSYIVGRGETLTSIARAHNVSVSELQRYNHIENPLKLQAGQTILIPPPATPAASASSSGE
jgi:LysM repeat protein